MTVKVPVKRFQMVPAKELIPCPVNWRVHEDQQTGAMKGLLDEIGFVGAVIAWERPDGKLEIIDGHLRQGLMGEEPVPVVVFGVDEATARKALATHDPIAALAGTDKGMIAELQRQLADQAGPIVRAILASQASGLRLASALGRSMNPTAVDPDDVPAAPDAATTKPGDVLVLGNHRLLCGDSSNPADVDRLLDGATIHLVNTDPPYNVKVEPRSNNAIAAGLSSFSSSNTHPQNHHQSFDAARGAYNPDRVHKKLRPKDRPLANDFVSDEEFDRLLAAWFGNLARVLEPGRAFYIWGGYANCGKYPPVLKATGLYFSQAVIWVKEHPVLPRKDFMGNHEWCFYGWREGKGHKFYGPNNAVDVWSIKKVNRRAWCISRKSPSSWRFGRCSTRLCPARTCWTCSAAAARRSSRPSRRGARRS